MIIEIVDLTNRDDSAIAQIPHLPDGYTLGDVFEKHPQLRAIRPHVVKAEFNGIVTPKWDKIAPQKHDRLRLEILPADWGISEISTAVSIAMALVSVVRFIISLVTSPKATKSNQARESAVYSFDGIHDTLSPGNPVPVIYGATRVGIQLLMYYIDVAPNGVDSQMHMLCGVCEGPILCIKDVEMNGTMATDITSVTVNIRLGYSSQTIIAGFERIKNTFSDGRPVSTVAIIGTTNGNGVKDADFQVSAPNGLVWFKQNKKAGTTKQLFNTVNYSIEYRKLFSAAWTVAVSPRAFSGSTQQKITDTVPIKFPAAGQYQYRLKWLSAFSTDQQNARGDIALANITEYEDALGPMSNTALIGINAAATAQLNGGRPNVTAFVLGKLVNIYNVTDTSTYSFGWTQNPAWNVIDYMTNSVYGMGGYVNISEVDLPSVANFAILASSRAQVCP